MKYTSVFASTTALALLSLPFITSAQTFGGDGKLKGYIESITGFINNTVIPVIVGLAILSFIWGMFRYFVWGAADEEARSKGKQVMVYSILGLVLILSFQGIVMLIAFTFGFTDIKLNVFPQVFN
jgi:hypothetical protein